MKTLIQLVLQVEDVPTLMYFLFHESCMFAFMQDGALRGKSSMCVWCSLSILES